MGTFTSNQSPQQFVNAAKISVQTVSSLDSVSDNQGHFGDSGTDNLGIWSEYVINCYYEEDRQIYMMPISSPNGFQGASVAFVQLAAKTLLWIVEWSAERYIYKPQIPDEDSVDPNWILMDKHLHGAWLDLQADSQSPSWRISGTYVYGHVNPPADPLSSFVFPCPPWYVYPPDRTAAGVQKMAGIIS